MHVRREYPADSYPWCYHRHKHVMNAHLIVFEGADAVGKSTLVECLRMLLLEKGVPAEVLAFPGDHPGTLGKLVYDLHHSPQKHGVSSLSPVGLQALHIAAHLDSIYQTIIPAITAGKWVVLDRFWWSTWVYGIASGVEPRVLESLIHAERLMWGSRIPSVVFLVERNVPLRPEQGDAQFTILKNLYRELSSTQRLHHEIINLVDEDLDSAKESIAGWVNTRLASNA